ncbi:MAG: hypothetical protein QXW37_01465 [Candidatus Nitrosotenuis sp.]
MDEITSDDRRRVELLETVSKKGLKGLGLEDLKELMLLIEKKDYSHNKKAQKSKMRLLAQINARIYDIEEKKF